MMTRNEWMGPGEDTYEYFCNLNDQGTDELVALRDQQNTQRGDGQHRHERTWGATKAAEMIGRSANWLRENDPEAPKNLAGRGRWSLGRINGLRVAAGTAYKRPVLSNAIVLAMSKFKGGVGNTTNTLHLAHGLAMKGLKVLVWDLDAQHSATQIGGGLVPDLELEDEDLPNSLLLENPSGILDPLCSVVRGTYFHNVDLVPANSSLNDLEIKLIAQYQGQEKAQTEIAPEYRVAAVLGHIKNFYDVVLLDCPPTLGMNTMNGLLAADGVITSLRPEMLDRASLVAFTDGLAGLISNTGKCFSYFRILISQFQDGISADPIKGSVKVSAHKRNEGDLRALYGNAVMNSMMHHSREIGAAATGMSTILANEKPVGSRGAYNRAEGVVNAVVNEVYSDLLTLWDMESDDDE
ncbi:ParA family protein [Marinobacter sp. ELB17]|uniref:ParA family protein n=1 Tax=Marinobacter sp. ELB17 TaxID=270374 RepID=UPI0000F381DB|nr:AAA family ATPase [Marinobacter sp. ELB17]EAZ98183.1 parA protein, putative [Marinobacter sp. ELB17]